MIAVIATLATASPVSADRTATIHGSIAATATPSAIMASPAACSDSRYNLIGPHWNSTLRWRYKSSTNPSGLSMSAVVAALKRGFGNITASRNDCGMADRVGAAHSYLGTTTNGIGVTKGGNCGSSDGANTVGFGTLPSGYLALTCVRSIGSRIVEIDIRFSTGVNWATSLDGCFNAYMLEGVTTHEVGHAYGLDHVGENTHGRLTMSTYIDGACQNQESMLGRGDVLALRSLY